MAHVAEDLICDEKHVHDITACSQTLVVRIRISVRRSQLRRRDFKMMTLGGVVMEETKRINPCWGLCEVLRREKWWVKGRELIRYLQTLSKCGFVSTGHGHVALRSGNLNDLVRGIAFLVLVWILLMYLLYTIAKIRCAMLSLVLLEQINRVLDSRIKYPHRTVRT